MEINFIENEKIRITKESDCFFIKDFSTKHTHRINKNGERVSKFYSKDFTYFYEIMETLLKKEAIKLEILKEKYEKEDNIFQQLALSDSLFSLVNNLTKTNF